MNRYSGRNAPRQKGQRLTGRLPTSTSGFPVVGRGLGGFPQRAWTPRELFVGGTDGAWYDPSDLSTLFVERTGLDARTPAVVGGPVGTMLDKSGRGHHATAWDVNGLPTLQQDATGRYCLRFVTDDGFYSSFFPSLDSSITAVFSARSNSGNNSLVNYGSVGTTAKLFAFSHWIIGEDCYVFSNGVDSSLNITIAEQNTQANHVMTFLIEIGRPGIVRFNGSGNLSGNTNNQIARTGTSVGSYIGRRDDPGYFLDGDYYGNLYYAGIPNTAQLARIERYFAKLSGAVLVTPPNL